jgi:hypothetical protein
MDQQVFFGNIFHALSFDRFELIVDGFIAVESGQVRA